MIEHVVEIRAVRYLLFPAYLPEGGWKMRRCVYLKFEDL
jgi:hypothetical protein